MSFPLKWDSAPQADPGALRSAQAAVLPSPSLPAKALPAPSPALLYLATRLLFQTHFEPSEAFSDHTFTCWSWPRPALPSPLPHLELSVIWLSPWDTLACSRAQSFLPWLHSACPKAARIHSFTHWGPSELRVVMSGPREPRRACSLPLLSLHPGRAERG